jgi:hypothetical protein
MFRRHHEKIGRIADLPRIARGIKRNVEKTFAFLTEESVAPINHDIVVSEAVVEAGQEIIMGVM